MLLLIGPLLPFIQGRLPVEEGREEDGVKKYDYSFVKSGAFWLLWLVNFDSFVCRRGERTDTPTLLSFDSALPSKPSVSSYPVSSSRSTPRESLLGTRL